MCWFNPDCQHGQSGSRGDVTRTSLYQVQTVAYIVWGLNVFSNAQMKAWISSVRIRGQGSAAASSSPADKICTWTCPATSFLLIFSTCGPVTDLNNAYICFLLSLYTGGTVFLSHFYELS